MKKYLLVGLIAFCFAHQASAMDWKLSNEKTIALRNWLKRNRPFADKVKKDLCALYLEEAQNSYDFKLNQLETIRDQKLEVLNATYQEMNQFVCKQHQSLLEAEEKIKEKEEEIKKSQSSMNWGQWHELKNDCDSVREARNKFTHDCNVWLTEFTMHRSTIENEVISFKDPEYQKVFIKSFSNVENRE